MWTYQWKMPFNPDVSKQAQEVIFSEKTQKLFHTTVLFNSIPVQRSTVQKINLTSKNLTLILILQKK